MLTITEGSRLPATFRLFDGNSAPAIPITLRYRIDCESTGKVLRDWTTVTAAQLTSLIIPASFNAIQNRANAFELKTLTVEADAGTDNAYTDDVTWRVRNMYGVS